MGGRASNSALRGITQAQQKKVAGLYRVAKEYGYEDVKVNVTKDGIVHYEYIKKEMVGHPHYGKFTDPEKMDIYERTYRKTGQIMPDGLRKQNKDETTERPIKKGKR